MNEFINLGWSKDEIAKKIANERSHLEREAEQRLEAEQAARAAEDARLRELYPLPEDEEEYGTEPYDENYPNDINSDQTEDEQ